MGGLIIDKMEKFRFLNKNKINQLPKTSGVYAFLDGKKILYIGKATNIKERVRQHKDLLGLAKKIGCIKTDSEIGALILEAKLIKQCQPKYNVLWRDDKNYFYVEVAKEDLPVISIVHQKNKKADYLGPFVEGSTLKRTLTYLRRVFPYYSAKSHPKGSCLWCHLKLCPGPDPLKSEYQKNIKNLVSVLKGNSRKVLNDLKREMNRASAVQEYEKAAKSRDKIMSLEKVISHARVFEPQIETGKGWADSQRTLQGIIKTKKQISRIEAYDVSNIQGKEATGSMVTFIEGKPDKNFYRKFKIRIEGKPNDTAMIEEMLSRRLKHPEWGRPDLILIDGGKPQLNAVKSAVKSRIPAIAIAKKKNELFIEGRKKPILLKSLPREIFNLILQLRDEAHRFAISYHHTLRKRRLLEK